MKSISLKFFLLLFIFIFFQPVTAFSQQEQTGTEQGFSISTDPSQIQLNAPSSSLQTQNVKQPSTIGLLFRMILVLAVVIGIIYVVVHFMKKTMKVTNDNDPFLRKVAQLNLSAGKSVQVVSILDDAYILGVTENSINLIGKVEDKELVNSMNLYADKQANVNKPKSFADILNIFMPSGTAENENVFTGEAENAAQMLKLQREKLGEGENNNE